MQGASPGSCVLNGFLFFPSLPIGTEVGLGQEMDDMFAAFQKAVYDSSPLMWIESSSQRTINEIGFILYSDIRIFEDGTSITLTDAVRRALLN